ncbi:MAG: ABC transporter ATP-binding protein [Devosiaceae bacterium]|nr:ABC transporter ATP-binding protein [Devosiaceae bacterium]
MNSTGTNALRHAVKKSNTDAVLSVRDLTVSFLTNGKQVPVVRGIDLDVFANEVHCIVGESGSGKSVTSLAVTGLLPVTATVSGSVRLDGVEVIGADEEVLRNMRGQDVGFIFQDPATTLNPVMRVGRQITEGQVVHGQLKASAASDRAAELMAEVDIADPKGRVTQYPHQFSGGMRQRAVIAMAMSGRPNLIVADEPTTALDVTVQAQVLSVLLQRQKALGSAIILITHDLGVVAEVADRVSVMYGGSIVETGTVQDIFDRPCHPYTAALLRSVPRIDAGDDRLKTIPGQPPTPAELPSGCVFHPRCALGAGKTRCQTERPQLRAFASGQMTACHFAEEMKPDRPSTTARAIAQAERAEVKPLLEVDNIKVHFPVKKGILRRTVGWVRAVDGVRLSVRPGETVSLVGESGCGKTTFARAIMGLLDVNEGDVRFDGRSIVGLSRKAMRPVRRQMQYVFQDPYSSLNPVLSAADIVAEPMRLHGLFEEMGSDKRIAELFEMVGLSPSMMGKYPSEFSGGQKQRLGIARTLGLKPKLLILDEPVAALDVSIQAQILNLLQDLQRELDLGFLFISHNLSVVRHISDRVAVMYLGKMVEEGACNEIYENAAHPYTLSLLSAAPISNPGMRNQRARIILRGDIPNPASPPSGCRFHPRCFRATDICRSQVPELATQSSLKTTSICHHAGPLDPKEIALASQAEGGI